MNTQLLRLKAKSSEGDGYEVDFYEVAGTLRVFCRCKAGVNRTLCKHVIALAGLDATMLHDGAQEDALRSLATWPGYSAVSASLEEMAARFKIVTEQKEALAAEEKKIRTHFASLLLKPRGA